MIDLLDFQQKLDALIVAEMPEVRTHFGIEYTFRRDGQGTPTASRVVVCECDEGGQAGSIGVVRHANRVPPDLGVERQLVEIEVWGYDSSAPSDSGLQWRAANNLKRAVWRHSQAIIRGERHVAPNEVPGIYQATVRKKVSPTERVHGCKLILSFWIDFSVRDIAPTTIEEPPLEVAAVLEAL
jgi:hypothetical protein